jgi:hypothetical protein
VAVRNVYKGDEFVAGLVLARVDEPPPVEEIANVAIPGQKTRPLDVQFGERAAHTVTRLGGREETVVIDTFDDYVLIVTAANGRTALIVADPNVR